jgi:hypothetical protein
MLFLNIQTFIKFIFITFLVYNLFNFFSLTLFNLILLVAITIFYFFSGLFVALCFTTTDSTLDLPKTTFVIPLNHMGFSSKSLNRCIAGLKNIYFNFLSYVSKGESPLSFLFKTNFLYNVYSNLRIFYAFIASYIILVFTFCAPLSSLALIKPRFFSLYNNSIFFNEFCYFILFFFFSAFA